MNHAVALHSITKTFGPKIAVSDLHLEIPEGSLTGFIGPNGAGKTTTIRMIMSIIFPDSGELSVLGKASAVESKDRIGYLPEERGVYKKMRVLAFLEYMARLKGIDGAGLTATVLQWLARVGLADSARKKCEELSKGMQQKVQYIAAVIHQPDLIILDEPFSGLDPVNSRLLRELIDEQHNAGRTIIFSTHQMLQAEALCDRIVMIHQGQKVLDDSPQTIRGRFAPHSLAVEFDSEPPLEALRKVGAVADLGRWLEVRPPGPPASVLPALALLPGLRRVEVLSPTLEDIFISIVERSGGTVDPATLRAAPIQRKDGPSAENLNNRG